MTIKSSRPYAEECGYIWCFVFTFPNPIFFHF